MGDPRKIRKKYSKPGHPWQRERIDTEREIVKKYGLKNKKELWKMISILKTLKKQSKNLVAKQTQQATKEKEQLFAKLSRLNILQKPSQLDEVLGLTLDDIMNRRLQTIVFKRGLSKSIIQARQFITHGHIIIGNQKIDSPSHLVNQEEETKISFSQNSSLNNPAHPERSQLQVTKKILTPEEIKSENIPEVIAE